MHFHPEGTPCEHQFGTGSAAGARRVQLSYREPGRSAHLSGKVAAALMAKAADLFSTPPNIEKVDVLASKLPA